MPEWLWSYVLTIVGLYGFWLTGNKNINGFVVGMGVQVLWIIYAVSTKQYGFIIASIAYGAMNLRNWRAWSV